MAFRIPLSAAALTKIEQTYVDAALASGWISGTGRYVSDFEDRLSELVGRAHTIAVANGTLALELALRALGVGPGDEVIVPALTFAAPAMSVMAVGAAPVLVDVAADSWTLAVEQVPAKLTARTRAIIAVDVLGHPADYDGLASLGLPVIEDAAQAHGARYKFRPAGSLGEMSVFSFHANKAVTTGEGGSVGTDSADLADQMRVIAHHGMTSRQPYVHHVIGRNFRMTNLAAAVGVGQLDRWDYLVSARNRVSALYRELLANTACGDRPVAEWADYSCWLHTITVDRRDDVVAYLRARGIDARAIWPCLADQPILAETGSYPVAQEVSRRAMWLPTHAELPEADIGLVASTLMAAISMIRGV